MLDSNLTSAPRQGSARLSDMHPVVADKQVPTLAQPAVSTTHSYLDDDMDGGARNTASLNVSSHSAACALLARHQTSQHTVDYSKDLQNRYHIRPFRTCQVG